MNRNNKGKKFGGFSVSSKFWRIFLVIVAALLIFAGPTYVPYLLVDILNMNYAVSIVLGFVLLIIGLGLMWYLIRKKVIA